MRNIYLLIFIFSLFINYKAKALDESTFRDIFKVDEEKKSNVLDLSLVSFSSRSKLYSYDMDQDGIPEYFQTAKIDGQDWFFIFERSKKILLKEKLDSIGLGSKIYKIRLVTISKDVKTLFIYYLMGKAEKYEFYSSAQLYMVNLYKKDIRKLVFQKGPRFSFENIDYSSFYYNRIYPIKIKDLNFDGTKEVLVKYKNISRIYRLNKNKWESL